MSAVLEAPNLQQTRAKAPRFAAPLLCIAFTLYYFADVLVRASEKYFWFDEIVTMNVCRFGSISAIWNSLQHGVDFNPLLFFVITNISRGIFGDNLIGPRVPEMIAFWVMCLCLFRFVNRRAGLLAGTIAMVLPTITGAFYYAYEARPHGLVLGFCGLALVCWQMILEQPGRRRWLVGFSLCIFGGCLMHCYAVLIAIPFGVVELINTIRFRRINWPVWIALVTPVTVACLTYVPLLIMYRRITKGTEWSQGFMTNLGSLAGFYGFLLYPCMLFLVASFGALAAGRIIAARSQAQPPTQSMSTVTSEVFLGVAFLAIPLFGFLLAKVVVHGLFEDRYFTSALIGVSILLGLAVGARGSRNWMPITLAVLLAFPVGWQFAALLWHRHRGVPEKLSEPSSGFTMNVSLAGPLGQYSKLLPKESMPIGTLRFSDFLYLLHYAPQLRPQLYYIPEKHDFFEAGFENFHPWAAYRFNNGVTPSEFVHLSKRTWIVGDMDKLREIPDLVSAGAVVTEMRVMAEDQHFMVELETK